MVDLSNIRANDTRMASPQETYPRCGSSHVDTPELRECEAGDGKLPCAVAVALVARLPPIAFSGLASRFLVVVSASHASVTNVRLDRIRLLRERNIECATPGQAPIGLDMRGERDD
jgi:hypothetical protein